MKLSIKILRIVIIIIIIIIRSSNDRIISQFLLKNLFSSMMIRSKIININLFLLYRSTRTYLLFYLHLMRQFLITKSFNVILSRSSSRINRLSYLSHLMFSFLIKSTTKLFRSIIRFQLQHLMTLTINLQSISISLFYSIFSKTLMKNYRFFHLKA